MEVAGVVIGSIMLLLAVTTQGPRLYHLVRFRKLVFRVSEEIELPVAEVSGYWAIGPGELVFDVEGAAHDVTLTRQELAFFDGARWLGLYGGETAITLRAGQSARIAVPVMATPGMARLLPTVDIEVYFHSGPREVYVVSIRLKLNHERSKYCYQDLGYIRDRLRRTVLRQRGGGRRFLRAISRGRFG